MDAGSFFFWRWLLRLGTFIIVVFFVSVVFLIAQFPRSASHRDAFTHVCDLVSDKFFRDDRDLNAWDTLCRSRSEAVRFTWSRERFLAEVQAVLDQLEVSHLMIYDPIEDRRLWLGEAKDTGIRARWIEEHLIVSEVLNQSPAFEAGVSAGDEILLVNQQAVLNSWQVESAEGPYILRRGEKQLEVKLKPIVLKIDSAPTLRDLGKGVGLLRIPSFRGEYFRDEIWMPLTEKLPSFQKIVVDLRKNSGGNMVSMLRALSPFFCEAQIVGHLTQPRRKVNEGPAPDDSLDEMVQLSQLERYSRIPLRTYGRYGCAKAAAVVLIDGGTASVSEIFAQAMLARARTRVLGQASAGDVLLATWYGLPQLGPGYSVSIPEVLYLTMSEDSLEGRGVWPQEELSYDLEDAYAGVDSWIKKAVSN